jgi:copper chaperone CopZ
MMKSLILLGALATSTLAFAGTTTYDVKGMHCGECQAAVEAKVCKMEGVKTCKVELIDKKKEMGKITLTTEDTVKITPVQVDELISSAGDYHVVRTPTSKKN